MAVDLSRNSSNTRERAFDHSSNTEKTLKLRPLRGIFSKNFQEFEIVRFIYPRTKLSRKDQGLKRKSV